MIKVVTINKNVKPSATERNKIFIGDGLKAGSFDPAPISNLIILFKKYSSNVHGNQHESQDYDLYYGWYDNKQYQGIKLHTEKIVILAPFYGFFRCCISYLCVQFILLDTDKSTLLYIFII